MANITGTNGSDTISPALVSPGVVGGPVTTGADSISGLAGNDVLDGGDGNDTLDGGSDNDSLTGGAGNDSLFGGDGNDTLAAGSIGGFNDTLNGGNGNDELRGRDAADPSQRYVFLAGLAGNDTLRGYGFNNNLAEYSFVTTAISANLATGSVSLNGGEIDTLIDIRGIRGGSGADTVVGSNFSDQIFAGNGADSIDAGAGSGDNIIYADAAAGVTIDLATGRATDAGGAIDTILGFENVQGSNRGDSIVGSAGDNILQGLAGNDTIDGGAGYDTVRYTANFNTSTFPQIQGVIVSLATGTATDAWGNTDTLTNIEAAHGSGFADDLTGAILASGEESNLRGLAGNDTLRAGIVTNQIAVDYREDPSAIRLNLGATDAVLGGVTVLAGTGRDGFGGTDTFVNIRTAIGSVGNDTIQGSEGGDRLYGWDGNDSLAGGAGDDTIYGGRGIDTYSGGTGYDLIVFTPRSASETAPTQGVVASLATGLIGNDGHGNAESLIGGATNDFEMLIGDSFTDDLTGKDAGLDANGLPIRTFLRGNAGDDTLRAATADRESVAADYFRDAIGVTVNLATGTATDGAGDTDTLVNIGGVRGSANADTLTGDANANWFRGEGGNDMMAGGAGVDLVSYSSSSSSVVVNLGTGIASDGLGGTDTLSAIENVVGGSANDTIVGSGAANLLLGLAGGDDLAGGAGNDTLFGGTGADTLDGGTGLDLFRYLSAGDGGDSIAGFRAADDGFEIDASGFGGGLVAGALDASRFVANRTGKASAAPGTGQFVFETDTDILRWDADGRGAGASVIIATIDGQNPTAADFLVVA